jgi:hypothetical protein
MVYFSHQTHKYIGILCTFWYTYCVKTNLATLMSSERRNFLPSQKSNGRQLVTGHNQARVAAQPIGDKSREFLQ